MGNKAVKHHLESAEKTGVLQLANCNLKEIPAQALQSRSRLRSLDLSNNKIAHLPGFVGEFHLLKQLNLDRNRLQLLPDEIGNLVKLEQLSAGTNLLTTMPSTVANLQKLRQVTLCSNCFSIFPTVLCELASLDVLDLSANQIDRIPDEVANLNAIELILNQNQLNTISEQLAKCKRLKVLRLEENCLPLGSFWDPILRDSSISLLAVDGNLFTMREFCLLPNYQNYMERFTATKKKIY
ncbi:Leucine-rich repeat-containing protein 57 [Trichinella zimbabwensis]|uniref:Leucine-rich repeat-containing protein 57 n=1 Tax=Trichinella zimbabwensis TaxID=268475 RepID=A0A0V1GZS3_9BILA|nr:Leucine-rich repeat-containing protein 57 [Trichinella zimbabwensis]